MRRSVTATMRVRLNGPTRIVLAVAPARPAVVERESLVLRHESGALPFTLLEGDHGARIHCSTGDAGRLDIEFSTVIDGRTAPDPVTELDRIRFLRPSRYCESDLLTPTARGEFAGLDGGALVDAVVAWVSDRLDYVPGSSLPTDGAARTLLNRQGVCRDYAHLVIAMLRAMELPARMVSVYAPGLSPMDFHAVVEAEVDGAWRVVDATGLAPRQSLLRISTGRDAADTAFLTTHLTDIGFEHLEVSAVVDALPYDDGREVVVLG